jgi:hypothetical protein
MSNCRSCNAPIVWGVTVKGARIPLDAEPSDKGTFRLAPMPYGKDQHALFVAAADRPNVDRLYLSHHATCPQGKNWKRTP